MAFDPDALDEPFDTGEEAIFAEYLAYLSSRHVPERYHPQFETEARALCRRLDHIPRAPIEPTTLEAYFEDGRRALLPERTLRNRVVGCDAFMGFLRDRSQATRRSLAPASCVSPPKAPSDKRRFVRVPFLTEIQIADFGVYRCADISAGGMYIENLTTALRGTLLRLRFKLSPRDADPISVTARVSFVHPQFGAGLEFVSISRTGLERIEQLVTRILDRAQAA